MESDGGFNRSMQHLLIQLYREVFDVGTDLGLVGSPKR